MVTNAAIRDRVGLSAAGCQGLERRAAARYASLIRAAKLVTAQGEFACVIRDVSRSGARLRLFHPLPPGCHAAVLELQNGERYGIRVVHVAQATASFMFTRPVAVERLVREHWTCARRPLRLRLRVPVGVLTIGGHGPGQTVEGHLLNLSQHGARIETSAILKQEHAIRLEPLGQPALRAKVRWRRGEAYGLVLERPLALEEVALMAARMQWPAMPHESLPPSRSSRPANS